MNLPEELHPASSGPVLVVGATGNIGRHAVAALLARGRPVRAFGRSAASAGFPAHVQCVNGDLKNPTDLRSALTGVGDVFVVFPTLQLDDRAPAVVATIAEHAHRVVYLSAIGADDVSAGGILGAHARFEDAVRQSDLRWTFLRSGGLATNLRHWAPGVRAEQTVRWPYPNAARSLIHEADLGEAAAAILSSHPDYHDRHVLDATGPVMTTHRQQVQAIADVLGQQVHYVEISRTQMRSQMTKDWGWGTTTADQALDTWESMVGADDDTTNVIQQLTGHPPRGLAQWIADHQTEFA